MPDNTSPAARHDPLVGLAATMLHRSDTFDTSRPTIRRLDPELLDAVRAAAGDARRDRVTG